MESKTSAMTAVPAEVIEFMSACKRRAPYCDQAIVVDATAKAQGLWSGTATDPWVVDVIFNCI